jgi:hypothetical protein
VKEEELSEDRWLGRRSVRTRRSRPLCKRSIRLGQPLTGDGKEATPRLAYLGGCRSQIAGAVRRVSESPGTLRFAGAVLWASAAGKRIPGRPQIQARFKVRLLRVCHFTWSSSYTRRKEEESSRVHIGGYPGS